MDDLFLDLYIAEIAPLLAGARIEKAYQYGVGDLALRVWLRPERRTLLLSADPASPLIALVDEEPPEPRERYALLEAVRSRAVPATLAPIEKLAGERVVVAHLVRSAGGAVPGDALTHRLVVELIPRASCLLLLDPAGRIVAGAGPGLPGRRGLGTGKPYVAPAPPPADPARGALAGISRTLQREVEARAARDGSSLEAAREALTALARSSPQPTLHRLPGGKLVATPLRFVSLEGAAEGFASFRELVAAYYAEAVVGRREETLRSRLRGAVARRLEKLAHTRSRVEVQADEAIEADSDRRSGELLLAYQATARAEGGLVSLPHPEATGETVVVPLLDPDLSLLENSRRYFERYRTRKRTAVATRARLAEIEAAREHLEEVDSSLETAELADLPALESELRAEGILGGGAAKPASSPKRAGSKPRRLPDALAPRVFRASGGTEILVGRSSRGNAHLTFALAHDHDFWLHAEGPGAHVVLRNPARAEEPPPEELLEAASLALWFSKLRLAHKGEVHWTERRRVQRVRGGPPGRVLLAAHRSLRVSPALAAERFGLDPGAFAGEKGDAG